MKAIIKQLVDGVWDDCDYNIDKGWTWIKNYNETLDSAVIKISHLDTKLDLQPFDNVKIEDDSENIIAYFCIDSYEETQASLDGPYYNYTINLFSETKKIENIILPNLSITPHRLSTPLTLEDYIRRIWNLYCPRYRDNSFKYLLPTTFPDKFSRVCPEKQWTTPTLRDVLNDLFMVVDCIPKMENNQITVLDLTATKKPIINYNYITRTRTSQDYASEIKMNLQNVLQEEYTTKTYTYQTFTTSEYILTSDNLMLETQYPILNIKHLWLNWVEKNPYNAWNADGDAVYMRADLCDLKLLDDGIGYSIVKEKKLYDVLPVTKTINYTFGYSSAEPYANCKNTCLYYTRGDNKIYGFSQVNRLSVLKTQQLLEMIVRLVELDWLNREFQTAGYLPEQMGTYITFHNTDLVAWSFPTFEIEYETTKEVVFSASKNEILRNERTIMDNQTNAWVNAASQGNLEYQKANRIGNEVVMINQRSAYLANVIDLGDKLGDEIVYRTEYQIFDNYVDVNAYATKDYILQDYFTGINSKIRTWINAQDEAFIRHDLYKYYVEFDEEESYEDDSIEDARFSNYSTLKIDNVLSIFKSFDTNNNFSDIKPIEFCLIRCDWYPSSTKCYIINLLKRVIGNSIVFTWGFNDNYVAVKTFNFGEHEENNKLKDDLFVAESDFDVVNYNAGGTQEYSAYEPSVLKNDLGDIGGVPLNAFPYCNKDGNFTTEYVYFLSELAEMTNIGEIDTRANYYKNITLPIASTISQENPDFNLIATVFKDNKEIITGSLQIEYISNSKKIYIYDSFLRVNPLLTDETITLNLCGANSLDETPTLITEPYTILVLKENDYSAYVDIMIATTYKYLYICKGFTPLIRTEVESFYINLLRKRDKEGL